MLSGVTFTFEDIFCFNQAKIMFSHKNLFKKTKNKTQKYSLSVNSGGNKSVFLVSF